MSSAGDHGWGAGLHVFGDLFWVVMVVEEEVTAVEMLLIQLYWTEE